MNADTRDVNTRELSHCLRTHLNGVFGMLQLLRATEIDEEQRLYLDALEESALKLLDCTVGITDSH